MRAALGTRYSAAVVRIERAGKLCFERAYGTTFAHPDAPRVYVDTRFDIASITKVYIATVALTLVSAGRVALDASLRDLVPEWRGTAHEPITLRAILAHQAGFRSGADYRTLLDRDVERFALMEALVGVPGAGVVYSDLGFIALGAIVARAGGTGLAWRAATTLAAFGTSDVGFCPAARDRERIAATERDAWRGLVHGMVHDEKAYLMNGVAGHAGLFADAADVARLGEWYLAAVRGRPTPLEADLARLAVREAAFDPVVRRGLGWALKTSDENSCGTRMSTTTFGHTGFTGTSIWVDPERDLNVVLLTNAVHLGRTDIRSIRAAVCDAAVAAADA